MNRVSPNYVRASYLLTLPWLAVPALGCLVGTFLFSPWLPVPTVLLMSGIAWMLWLIPAQASRMGWLETEDDLLITKGRLWHTFTVVPYGRIQFVDVTAGPVWRAFSMKNLTLHTASSTSDSKVRALPAEVADELRDRLADRARERMSGL